MQISKHGVLQGQAVMGKIVLRTVGSYDDHMEHPKITIATTCVLLSVGISLLAIVALVPGSDGTRMKRALCYSVYSTVPFAILDTLYCGVYLGYGSDYIEKYWYLSVYYITPWLTFPPTAYLLRQRRQHPIP